MKITLSLTSFTPEILDASYIWLCASRKNHPANADVWDLRFHWLQEKVRILQALRAGTYRLQPLRVTPRVGGEACVMWSARDALVIHALTCLLAPHLPVHHTCEHIRGQGGGKQSARRVHHFLRNTNASFVFRTDIRGYYANIDKDRLYRQLTTCITCPGIRSLLWQFLYYSVENGGNFHTPVKGIPRASSLSPLLAAFHLFHVDKALTDISGVRYARYMDDFIIITTTRHKLRRAVKLLKQRLHEFGFVLHPDKTQLGRTQRGFDWMGLWFTDKGITAFAPRATEKHRLKCRQLYEHIRHLNPEVQATRMALYLRRWVASLLPLCATDQVMENSMVQVSWTSVPSGIPSSSGPLPSSFIGVALFRNTKPNSPRVAAAPVAPAAGA
ncbi:reverse transcriptase domain-containing protein [Yokenella regensburgei]|uniref:Group II intron-encoded protein ltrA n=1 Tax=Yokenella regensburgei TaxID=158877 RepID=A0AB38FUS5_9ENTR|nr:reverse transcriptase domain-containing protein [Yokenella regensburgei]KFD24794.1 retron-type RNA-directed DNA polymerase [Yokenella regensburgei ATCC 49455]SQA62990.1 Group II intron-encoded protein ltrA [Yokenella regensburgei]SQB02234.1 Group II intron-encoded protein ltrA [Yokenella regensburgei]SUQ07466.1 Group II intron-encoded protein ltrA [Yokenella regensburgei]